MSIDLEQRRTPRIPVENVREVTIRTPSGDEFQALGRDDSAGGMGVLIQDPVDLKIDDPITLSWQGVELSARVAHLEKRNHGMWSLGFAWQFTSE